MTIDFFVPTMKRNKATLLKHFFNQQNKVQKIKHLHKSSEKSSNICCDDKNISIIFSRKLYCEENYKPKNSCSPSFYLKFASVFVFTSALARVTDADFIQSTSW